MSTWLEIQIKPLIILYFKFKSHQTCKFLSFQISDTLHFKEKINNLQLKYIVAYLNHGVASPLPSPEFFH